MLGRIKMNNIVRVFEEGFIRLMWHTKRTPLVKLNKKISEQHARVLARLALPGRVHDVSSRVMMRRAGSADGQT